MDIQNQMPYQPSPAPVNPSGSKWGLIVGGITLAVIVGVVGYLLGVKKYNVSQESPTPNPSTWETYRNNQYGFEIKLPPYWDGYKTTTRELTTGGTSIGFDFPYARNGVKTYYENALQIVAYPPSAWASVEFPDGSKPPKLGEGNGYVYSYAKGTDMGGNADLERASRDIETILDTFKITESSDASSWKTYTNTQYGFEIKYPSSFSFTENSGQSSYYKRFTSVDIGTLEYIQELKTPREGTEGLPLFLRIVASEPKQLSQTNDCGDYKQAGSVTVGDTSWLKCEFDLMGSFPSFFIRTAKSNLEYVVESNRYSGDDKVLIDQIIATFKFTK